MFDLIDLGLVLEVNPSLSPQEAGVLLAAVNSQVRRVAPCLSDATADQLAEAVYVVTEALRRPAAWIDSESTGPFTVKYRALLSGRASVLNDADVAALQGLCGAAVPVPGLSRGSFPEPSGIEGLYSRPRY